MEKEIDTVTVCAIILTKSELEIPVICLLVRHFSVVTINWYLRCSVKWCVNNNKWSIAHHC